MSSSFGTPRVTPKSKNVKNYFEKKYEENTAQEDKTEHKQLRISKLRLSKSITNTRKKSFSK